MATGTRYTYTDTGNQRRAISDLVMMMDWTTAPLLRLFGFTSATEKKFRLVNWPSTKVEWIEDTMSPTTGATAEALDDSETGVDVATGTGGYFRQGDILLIESEQMLVTSVSTDTLTVTRGYGGTTAAAHATNPTAITIVGRAMPEGSDYVTGHTTSTTQPYNYTQILSEAVKVTRTEMKMSKYGVDDSMDYHIAKKFNNGGTAGSLAQMLQRTFYYGKRVQRTSSAYGSMGGFESFVTTNVTNKASAAVTRADIHTIIRQIRDAGGECDKLVTGSWGVEKINGMFEGLIRTTRDEKRGGSEITMIKTPHGEVEVVYDWMCPSDRMYFVNSKKLGWLPFDDFNATEIRPEGDYFITDVVGEYTFILANEESHGYIYGISTTK